MLIRFFLMLRAAGVPVSVTEFLALLDALSKGTVTFAGRPAKVTVPSEAFPRPKSSTSSPAPCWSRTSATSTASTVSLRRISSGAEAAFEALLAAELPADWLKNRFAPALTEEEKARIESLGGWDALMETLRQRLAEQKARHQGGDRWIGTGGTSPFGNAGYNPEGVRIGGEGGNRRAVKVWDRREFANLDDSVELGTRNVKLALGACGASRARARPTRSTSTPPSSRRRGARGCSTSAWSRNGTTR